MPKVSPVAARSGTPLCHSRHGGPPKRATKFVDANSPLKAGDGYSPMDGRKIETTGWKINSPSGGGTAQGPGRTRNESRPRSRKPRHNFDQPHDVFVERRQVLSGYPIFLILRAARVLHLVTIEERLPNLEAQDIPSARFLDVPVTGDPDRVGFGQNGIEDRLFRQARRESAKSALSNKIELLRTDGSIERDGRISGLSSVSFLMPPSRASGRGRRIPPAAAGP